MTAENSPAARPTGQAKQASLAQKLTRRLVLITVAGLIVAAAITAYLTVGQFTRHMRPELANKAQLVGQIIAADLQRAIDLGIPLDKLVGAKKTLESLIADSEDVAFVAVAGRDGTLLYSAGKVDPQLAATAKRLSQAFSAEAPTTTTSGITEVTANEQKETPLRAAVDYAFPVRGQGGVLGLIHVGIDRRFITDRASDIGYDMIVILIVGLLMSFEVMLAVILYYAASPITALGQLLSQYATGDFSRVLASRSSDAAGQLTSFLYEQTQRLHRRFRIVLLRALRSHEVKAAHEAKLAQEAEAYEAARAARAARVARGETHEALAAPPTAGAPREGRKLTPELQAARESGSRSELSERIVTMGSRFGMRESGGPEPILQASTQDIRIPLFMFAFAEELQKSFLPLFVRSVYRPIPWLSESVVIGLPIAVYLGMLALAAPYAGRWCDRHGASRMFIIGLLPAVAGYIGCAFATTIYELILWRGITAGGYALVTIACQEYAIATSTPETRARAIAVFIAVVMSACMCGTAIGGILADRLGYRLVFGVAALVALGAGFAARWMLADKSEINALTSADEAKAIAAAAVVGLRERLQVFKNRRFIVFLLTIAVPTNVLVAAVLWYMVPLYLSHLGTSQAAIGRIMMSYYLLIVASGTLGSRFGENKDLLIKIVGIGSLCSAAGAIGIQSWESLWAVVIAVIVMGAAHALTRAPQIPLALEICSREIATMGRTTVLSVLRSIERIGSIIGLLAAASMVTRYGYQTSIGVIGYAVSVAAVFFIAYFAVSHRQVVSHA